MTLGVKDKVSKLEFVRWVDPYKPAYKISSVLMGSHDRITPTAFHTTTISVEAFKPTPIGNLRVLLHKAEKI